MEHSYSFSIENEVEVGLFYPKVCYRLIKWFIIIHLAINDKKSTYSSKINITDNNSRSSIKMLRRLEFLQDLFFNEPKN